MNNLYPWQQILTITRQPYTGKAWHYYRAGKSWALEEIQRLTELRDKQYKTYKQLESTYLKQYPHTYRVSLIHIPSITIHIP